MQPQTQNAIKVENKLKFWAQELHDMSGRNRLLFYKETKTSTATIEKPDFASLFTFLVEQDGELFAPLPDPKEKLPLFDVLPETENQNVKTEPKPVRKLKDNEIQTNHSIAVLNKVLYNLRYASRTVQEEQGFNILYITFGVLKWRESQNSDFSLAPLILVPVQVDRDSPAAPYKIRVAEDDIVVNPVLQTKLSKEFSIELPEISNDITTNQLVEFLQAVSNQVRDIEGWEVQNIATIGIFNFLTLLLIKDFENNADLYREHPIVQALSGAEGVIEKSENIISASNLDDMVDPGTVFQIMDADSSQQEAIEAAKQGISFVLQGPPGTGKSQTIANIIAEFMMAGKRVLFVSQKMAALEVVQSRLTKKGLGEFCLEVHSHKMDKKKVIENLTRALSNSQAPLAKRNYREQQQEVKQMRNELNTYVRQLHQTRFELGISLHTAYGHLAKYYDETQLNFFVQDLSRITPVTLRKSISLIREISNYVNILHNFKVNRWKGFRGTQISIQEKEQLSVSLRQTAQDIQKFCQIISKFVTNYGLPAPTSIKDCVYYLSIFDAFTPEIFTLELRRALLHE